MQGTLRLRHDAHSSAGQAPAGEREISIALWIVQGLLALLFLYHGTMKLIEPVDGLAALTGLPVLFLRFIGLAEVLGALGLVLPGLLRIRPGLTTLAAAGLALIMAGAAIMKVADGHQEAAHYPLVVGVLALIVAYGRLRLAPLQGMSPAAAHRSTD